MFINCKGKLLSLEKPVVMGILNLTPDSFFAGSRVSNEKSLLETCEKMLADGATIIDIGGYSSRPGAPFVTEAEESERVLNSIQLLHSHFGDIVISVDTFRSSIARRAVENGAAIINDISSGEEDPDMLQTVADLQVPYIMMHKRGNPQTMQQLTQYQDVTKDVLDYFIQKLALMQPFHIHDIIIDPGFGFAKTLEQNYSLLNHLELFKLLKKPLLVGISRKKMLQIVAETDAAGALNSTTIANTIALLKGASILRVHDVKEAVECIKITGMLT